MSKPSVAQAERARHLLATEGYSDGSADECAAAAGRVYEKLGEQLAPLIGPAGVQALFQRSSMLAQVECAALVEIAGAVEISAKLRSCFLALAPAAATEAATLLFGTFLDLLVTFIGDRLTVQVLRGAWPAIQETAPTETKQ